MSYADLAAAVTELKENLNISGRDELFKQAITSTSDSITTRSKVLQLVMDIVDGGTPTSTMIAALREFASQSEEDLKDLTDIISIIYTSSDGGLVAGSVNELTETQANNSASSPSKSSPQISLIQVKAADVTPASRMADAASILMNSIPSYEWSRAVPYLSVVLLVSRPAIDENGKISALSLGRFLLGNATVSGTERTILEASEFSDGSRTATGMEIFTSPQTLINADEASGTSGESVRFSPVIDPFRPFMSVQRLSLNIANMGGGIQEYKQGKIDLILHDRSRMGEIADLIRPDLYSSTELLIEYGWSHPDGGPSSANAFGRLINAARIKEKYMVKNNSFEFQDGGAVNITLEIATKGITDLATTKVGESQEVITAVKEVERLTEVIATIRSKMINSPTSKEVGVTQILESTSDISHAMTLSDDLKKAIDSFLHHPGETAPDTDELITALEDLLGDSGDGTNGAVGDLSSALEESFRSKSASLSNGIDPMLDTVLPSEIQSDFPTDSYVSLGKILLRYMAEPLTATGRFDEVQVITYNFNSGCGAMRNRNIGSLPLLTTTFKSNLKAYTAGRGHFNLTIKEFLDYIVNSYIDDFTNPAFGVANRSEYSFDFKDGALAAPPTPQKDADETKLQTAIEARMKKLGIPDGEFVPPQITFNLEAVPRAPDGEEDLGDPKFTLLRIHVCDDAATPYAMYQKLLDAMKNRHLGTIGIDTGTAEGEEKAKTLASDVLRAAERLDPPLIEIVNEQKGVYKLGEGATPARLKKFVADRVPYIRYGSAGTGIKRAGVRSIHDPMLAASHMHKMFLGDPTTAPGIDGDIVPLRMLPTEIQMETFGNPFILYNQQFFVDFDTGTTIDNIYYVNGADFTIEAGKFDTSIKMMNMQAFGTFRSAISSIQAAVDFLKAEKKGS